MQSLAHITILDLTRLLPGGFCFPPLGATQNTLFTALDRGKRSLTLNLKAPEGRALLLELTRNADVLIESFRPGVLARLGLDAATLHATTPRLVICAISGYGQHGPLRAQVGHDLNYLGYAGALLQVADLGGDALTAAAGILAALLERERTGRGEILDIALTDGVLHWLALHAAELWATGAVAPAGVGRCWAAMPATACMPPPTAARSPWLRWSRTSGSTCATCMFADLGALRQLGGLFSSTSARRGVRRGCCGRLSAIGNRTSACTKRAEAHCHNKPDVSACSDFCGRDVSRPYACSG